MVSDPRARLGARMIAPWWLWCLMLVYLTIGALQLGLVWDNLRRFQDCLSDSEPSGDDGQVAVLVPARNEGPRIGECVSRVLSQALPGITLHVLDDQSGDDTQARAIAAAGADSRFTLLVGNEAPQAHWNGKSWACQRLAEASRGDWLCFLDADTQLAPGALQQALQLARQQRADLLSFWPRQVMLTPGERLMMPLLVFVLLAHLPLRLVSEVADPRFSAANGQCLLIRRSVYQAVGGHAAIHSEMVDDIALARLVKAHGGRVVIRDAGEAVTCRMYEGWPELWAGFRKNLFPAFGGHPAPFLFGVSVLGLWHVVPVPLVLLGLGCHSTLLMVCGVVQSGFGLVIRGLLAARLGQPFGSVWCHPVAALCLVVLALDSWRGWVWRGVEWKGRSYGQGMKTAC